MEQDRAEQESKKELKASVQSSLTIQPSASKSSVSGEAVLDITA